MNNNKVQIILHKDGKISVTIEKPPPKGKDFLKLAIYYVEPNNN